MGRKRKKGPPWWRRRFLRALGRTANARGSAREAGIDPGTAYNHAKRNPAFDRAWKRAAKIGQARLELERTGGSALSPSRRNRRPRFAANAGEEMVVRHSKKHGPKMVRAGKGRRNAEADRVFFEWLEETGTVRRSARAAGFSTTAVYKRRKADPVFAARWDAALGRATPALRAFLVGAAVASFDPETAAGVPVEGAPAPPKVTVSEAIAILKLDGGGRERARQRRLERYGPKPPTIEQVRANILKRLDAIEAHEKRKRNGGAAA